MCTRWTVFAGAVGLVGVFGLGVGLGTHLAQHPLPVARAATACSNGVLSGSYGVNFSGTSQGLGRFASVSLWQFDGYGGFSASETFNSEQQTGSRDIAGSYSVNPDCTFTLSYNSELVRTHDVSGVCIAVSGGAEFDCVDSDAGWVALGIGKKV